MITIPDHFWSKMLDEFVKEPSQVEQVAYLDGIVADGAGIVTTLTIPNARLHAQRFEVSPEAMSQAGKHFRAYQMKRLAQVHTHPGPWTGHSPWDDAKAYSQLTGAISIVLPNFARGRPRLMDAGVHLRTESGWKQLTHDEAMMRVRIVPSFLDFRTHRRSEHDRPRVEPPRKRPWWKALAFWRRE